MLQTAIIKIDIIFFNQKMREIVTHKSMIFLDAQGETFKEMFQAWKNYYSQALDLLEMDL